ncbi:hypothetical protein [Sphingosinicella sp. BN140058]|uniref:hypothetical protein n=1 Tax=Sphingosinicella sp. BN140058 TaxID=1892855 RepID=UPI0010118319|nr:hypothetical protein [Sphingosinicella sp. BN140058]QAY80431.1 hypothetical protein ETR14_27720 [Sphingosinicella sp. BN140058]
MSARAKTSLDPFWLRANDDAGPAAAIDDEDRLSQWLACHGTGSTVDLMQGHSRINRLDCSHICDLGSFIDALIALPSPDGSYGSTFSQIYTAGNCDVFAVAFQGIAGGDLYAVTDPKDDKGRRVRLHSLVHAGVYSQETVYDIEGAHSASEWSLRWRQNGGCTDDGTTDIITAARLQRLQMCKHSQTEIAAAARIAWPIAALTGALDAVGIARYRAARPALAHAA